MTDDNEHSDSQQTFEVTFELTPHLYIMLNTSVVEQYIECLEFHANGFAGVEDVEAMQQLVEIVEDVPEELIDAADEQASEQLQEYGIQVSSLGLDMPSDDDSDDDSDAAGVGIDIT